MKRYFLMKALLVVFIGVSVSCKKGFKELNTNPNTSEHVLPQNLLAPALVETVSANMRRSQNLTNELMQVTVNMGDTDGKIFRYDIRKNVADYLWNSWYRQLTNFKDIYTFAEEINSSDENTKGYMGISLVCQSWVYSMLTDTYGDVPYFNSNKAKEGIMMPAFDKQKDIYLDIFDKLEQANQLLKEGTNILATSDPVYGGNVANWRKFSNSLYLRLLLRVSAKGEVAEFAIAKIKEIVDEKPGEYPIIGSNAESAILRWTGVAPYNSPFATWKPADWYNPKTASFFVDRLVDWGDPRLAKWVTLSEGEYAGVESGYAEGTAPRARSYMPTALQSEPLLGNIMNFAEIQFILAEAASREWITARIPSFYYQSGITNAIALWGFTASPEYLNNGEFVWDDDYSLEQKLEMIHQQKYYALFFTDVQSWLEYRRTGHPVLPKGAGLKNNKVMPARLNYPIYVQATNGDNYAKAVAAQGPDEIYTQVWWQKP